MALTMARPWKHPKTGVYYLRKRVPLDLVAVVGRSIEKRTLGTKDVAEARKLHAEALFAVEARWRNLRVGLFRPTPREIAAVAGEFYRQMVRDAERGRYSPFYGPTLHAYANAFVDAPGDAGVQRDFRYAFGSKIDEHLASLGLTIDPEYVVALDLGVARAVRDAQAKSVEIVFEGDASPDPRAARYPLLADALPAERQVTREPGEALRIEVQFAAYAKAAEIAASTRKRWGQALGHLPARLGHDDLRRITPEDVSDWITHLRKEGLSERTIRDVQLSALRALLGWLVGERKLPTNAASGFRIRVPKSDVLRHKSLSDAEARKILAAALAPQSSRLSPKHAAARRWVPWLCAYTGARVNELTQLRAEDVFEVNGIPVIKITPEAGTVKTGRFRDVPLHPHLIEQGFLKFARKRRTGPLFYDPNPDSVAITPPYKKMGERLAAWVREIGVTDPAVDPNHGWRHRFKTIGRRCRMQSDVLDAIQGHVPHTEGGAYGEFEPETMLAEIVRIPKYEV